MQALLRRSALPHPAMVVFTNLESLDRMIYAIAVASTTTGKTTPSNYLRKQLDVTDILPTEGRKQLNPAAENPISPGKRRFKLTLLRADARCWPIQLA